MKRLSFLGIFAVLTLLIQLSYPLVAIASEFSVSGNGDGSQNNINFQDTRSDSVSQENSAALGNEESASSETGGNSANGNSSDSAITTGDSSVDTNTQNSGNVNQASVGCCADDSTYKITDNGANSNNQINANQNNSTNLTQGNNAKITNNIYVNANTGDNEANDNSGDVTITTGNVNVLAGIINQGNSNYVSGSSAHPSSKLIISGNGAGSTNNIDENYDNQEFFSITNALILNNNISSDLNTGGNKAKGNKGSVFISTGSVMLDIILFNRMNENKLIAECCKKGQPTPTPTPTPTPSGSPNPSPTPQSSCCSPTTGTPGGGGGGSSSGSASSGGSSGGGGEVLGATLPATGGMSIWLMSIFALLMLSVGIILRLDYGKTKLQLKKIYQQFSDYLISYTFGVYLFTHFKVLSAYRYP